jgi:hypothetical protein
MTTNVMNESPWASQTIPRRYTIAPNDPRYPQYAPFVYNRFEKGQNRFKQELQTSFFSGTGGNHTQTVGHPMYSPFPGTKISYDSHNLPDKGVYNAGNLQRLSRTVARDNDERYRVSRLEGTAQRKPFRD